jgi:hypothetical protein
MSCNQLIGLVGTMVYSMAPGPSISKGKGDDEPGVATSTLHGDTTGTGRSGVDGLRQRRTATASI